jgi:phosphate transport system substrate-binding protein
MMTYLRKACLAIAFAGTCTIALADELKVVGTGDGIELLNAVAVAYNAEHPQTIIAIPPSIGSPGGFAAVSADKEVLARVARPIKDSETALGLVAVHIFELPSAFFAHRSAAVGALSAQQLADIYAGKIVNWNEVGGADLRIRVVRREEADSTLTVLRQTMPGWKDLVITEKSKTALTTQDCVSTVKTVEGAIGFGPYTKALDADLSVIKVNGKFPTQPGYPSAVMVSLVYKQSTVTPEAKKFIAYAKSEAARALLQGLGAVPVAE